MTQKPIDAHCHLLSARYVVEEAAAMGWAYVTGNYPHTEAVTKAAPAAESLFSWRRLLDAGKWFFDLGAAVSSNEANYQSIPESRDNSGTPPRTLKPKAAPSAQIKNVIDGIIKLCFVYS